MKIPCFIVLEANGGPPFGKPFVSIDQNAALNHACKPAKENLVSWDDADEVRAVLIKGNPIGNIEHPKNYTVQMLTGEMDIDPKSIK